MRFEGGDRNRSFSSENENVVLQSVEENPSTSVRMISRASHISKTKVHTILKRNKLYPFHLTPVQALNDGDSEKRLHFCNLIIEKYQTDDSFLQQILWTDESTFTRDGTTNFHNMHHYAKENPHVKFQRKHQYRFSINVWAGLIGKKKISALIFPFFTNKFYHR